ncbi:DUF6323 family protein [Oscillospiraceae bacterium PP1C4]
MSELMSLLFHDGGALSRQDANELLHTNDVTCQFGLALTRDDALALIDSRNSALVNNGRVEIGSSVLERIILKFCDSPYLCEYNYTDTIGALAELFYYMKNETLDLLTDDELIQRMRSFFDGSAGGSLDLLAGRELDLMARSIRAYGKECALEENDENELDEDDEWGEE